MRSQLQKELIRCDGLNAESLSGAEIGKIEGDDIRRSRCQRGLENHVILRIGGKWSPKKMNSLVGSELANAVENIVNLGRGETNAKCGSMQNIFVFCDKRHRKNGLEMPCIHAKKGFMAGALGGLEGGHDHIGVENSPDHDGSICATVCDVNRRILKRQRSADR